MISRSIVKSFFPIRTLINQMREMMGTLPLIFKAYGKPLINYKIYGNSEVVNGNTVSVGNQTQNLFDGSLEQGSIVAADGTDYNESKISCRTNYINVSGQTEYTVSITNAPPNTIIKFIGFYGSNNQFSYITVNTPTSYTFTTPSYTNRIRIVFRNSTDIALSPSDFHNTNIQIEKGSSPTEYEPYGYKIPIILKGKNLLDSQKLFSANSGMIGSFQFSNLLEIRVEPNTYYTLSATGKGSLSGPPSDRCLYINTSDSQNTVFNNHPVTVLTDNNGQIKIGFINNRTYSAGYINGTYQIQLEKGSANTKFKPYYEPIVTNIFLNQPLTQNEYIDFQSQKRYPSMENIVLPPIMVFSDTNTLTVDTDIQPANVCIKGKIKKLPLS